MNTFVIAWVMLLLFALFNNYVMYRLLKQRGRTDLMWVSVVATVIPIALFAFWPNAFTLMAFPLVQSVGMLTILRMVQR
ncbi:hypothetical protein [Meiothermus sp.]|uniref:hypothetical protein n=1 Tax=Meiothermus sp. TaxID=1955249 RepID=UPI00307E23F2